MKSNLDKLNQEIDTLAKKIEHMASNAKAEAAEKLHQLRDQAQRLRLRYDQVHDASANNRNLVKAEFSTGYADLRTGIRNTRQWLNEKIAPKN